MRVAYGALVAIVLLTTCTGDRTVSPGREVPPDPVPCQNPFQGDQDAIFA